MTSSDLHINPASSIRLAREMESRPLVILLLTHINVDQSELSAPENKTSHRVQKRKEARRQTASVLLRLDQGYTTAVRVSINNSNPPKRRRGGFWFMQYFCRQLLNTVKHKTFHLIRPWMQHGDKTRRKLFILLALHLPAHHHHQFSDRAASLQVISRPAGRESISLRV